MLLAIICCHGVGTADLLLLLYLLLSHRACPLSAASCLPLNGCCCSLAGSQQVAFLLCSHQFCSHGRAYNCTCSCRPVLYPLLVPAALLLCRRQQVPFSLDRCICLQTAIERAMRYDKCAALEAGGARLACELDKALANVGTLFAQQVQGRVSTEVDPRLAYNQGVLAI